MCLEEMKVPQKIRNLYEQFWSQRISTQKPINQETIMIKINLQLSTDMSSKHLLSSHSRKETLRAVRLPQLKKKKKEKTSDL